MVENVLDIDDPQALELNFEIRSCEAGEELLSSGKCRKCDLG